MMGTVELGQVRRMCARLAQPNWMDEPGTWVWQRPSDGALQGFGLDWRSEPGLANLLWLVMDMGTPPREFDLGKHPLCSIILMFGWRAKLCGEMLTDRAAFDTLQEFHDRLPATVAAGAGQMDLAYPLLKRLAARRLAHG